MPIVPAAPPDVDEATRCLTAAFAADPLITYFFRSSPLGRNAACHAFFSLLLRARLALGMPVLLAKGSDAIVGAAMGIGGALLEAFCGLSANDPRSCGVYLETATPANLPYYERYGFARTAEGALDDTATLWCLFRPDVRSGAGG
jgi:hypothetical protein